MLFRSLLQIAGADSNDQKLREAAAKIMFSIFVQAFRQWVRSGNMVEERKFWKTHVDRNVQRHLTLLTWAQRAGILKKQLGRAGSLGVQNDEGEWYAVVEYCLQHTPKMLQLHSMGRLLGATKIQRPTCNGWP